MKLLSLIILAATLGASAARADEADADLDAANRAYQAGHYDESARLFNGLIQARGYSAPLLFDAGNAELKAGQVGAAMLDYERARYLAPDDAGIDHNLQLARKQAGLDANSYRWWEVALRSINWLVWLTVILVALVLIILAIIGLVVIPPALPGAPKPPLRKLCRAALFICIPVCLFFCFVELSAVGFSDRIEGVVTAKSATLRLSPFESAERTGSISEGELVTVENRHNDYIWVDDGPAKQSGWVSVKEVEPVVPGSFDAKASGE